MDATTRRKLDGAAMEMEPEPIPLSRAYAARVGAPVITEVDPRVFTARYFGVCMSCTWCRDACCHHGVDVDGIAAAQIMGRAEEIEAFTGRPRTTWFHPEERDEEMPGGSLRRTRVTDGGCVFLNPAGRGCLLHAFAVEQGMDYHILKPMISALFPLTFGGGTLTISEELELGSLVCGGAGPTAYEAARNEVRYYFGDECVAELDRIGAVARASA